MPLRDLTNQVHNGLGGLKGKGITLPQKPSVTIKKPPSPISSTHMQLSSPPSAPRLRNVHNPHDHGLSEYIDDILDVLRNQEASVASYFLMLQASSSLDAGFLRHQSQFTENHRAIMINWMVLECQYLGSISFSKCHSIGISSISGMCLHLHRLQV
jgi:hypothetical protein